MRDAEELAGIAKADAELIHQGSGGPRHGRLRLLPLELCLAPRRTAARDCLAYPGR